MWCGLNALVALAVTAMTLLHQPPPALRLMFDETQLAQLDPRALAVVNAQAAIANPLVVALCGMSLVLCVRAVERGERWAWLTLALSLGGVQAFGFVSDAFLGQRNLAANVGSTLVLATSLALLFPRAQR